MLVSSDQDMFGVEGIGTRDWRYLLVNLGFHLFVPLTAGHLRKPQISDTTKAVT